MTYQPPAPRRIGTAIGATALIVAIGGCTSQPATVNTAPTITTPASTSSAPIDAAAVLARLSQAGLPMSNPVVQDETNDPNDLLGRPNGYIARGSFDVAGGDPDAKKFDIDRGGVVEVWPDEAAARARSAYIQDALKSMPMLGTEFHYVRGPVLLRITGKVVPSVAAKFEAALGK